MLQNRPTNRIPTENKSPPFNPPQLPEKPQNKPKKFGWFELVLFFVAAVYLLERNAPENFKPSTFYGGFSGHEEAVALRTKLAETQAILAAQNEENARMQQEVEYFKAKTDRVTEAYKIIYARTNIMAQSYANLSQQYLTMRQQTVNDTLQGDVLAANLSEMFSAAAAAFGEKEKAKSAHETANAYRKEVLQKLDGENQNGLEKLAANISSWQNGLPNPADIIAEDRVQPLKPAPRLPAPPKPKAYQTQN